MHTARILCLFFILVAGAATAAQTESPELSKPHALDSLQNNSSADTLHNDSLPPIEKMPELRQFVKAVYPGELVKQGVEGTVLLDIVVSDSGRVDSVYVTKGIHPVLDSSAAAAARAFTFSPATAGGKPVAVILEYAYRFTIDEVVTTIDRYCNLQGRLYERGTRAPITNATVAVNFLDTAADTALTVPFHAYLKKIGSFKGQSLQTGSLITVTDSLGRFQFTSLPACSIAVKIIAPDFEILTDRLLVGRGKVIDMVYRLQRVSYGDNELVVYGKVENKEVTQRTLTLNEVRRIPGFGGDAVKVIQALPGVARSSFASGSVIVRGSGTGDSHFYIDGITLPVLFHFGGITSTYNSEALASVDLYPGGFGTRYGNAMGGVVEITGRKPKTDRVHGYLDGNLFDASFLVEGPLSKKVSILVAGRRSYIADVLSFFLKNVLHRELPFTVVPYYWDYIARVDYVPSSNQHCYATFFGSKDKLTLVSSEIRGGSAQINDQTNEVGSETYFHLGIAGWDFDINKKLRNELRYALCYLDQSFIAAGRIKIGGNSLAQYLRDEFSYIVSDALKWHFGLDMQYVPYNLLMVSTNRNNEFIRDTANFNLGPMGAYCFLECKPIAKLTLIPGLRYDYYPELAYKGSVIPEFWNYGFFNNHQGTSGEPSLRLTAKYRLFKGHLLKASVGTYNETPQPQGQSIDKMLGNPALPAQKGSQYVAGYEWKISDLVSADLQGYINTQWDDARRPDSSELEGNISLPPFIGNGRARMKGIELMLKHDQGSRFFGWLAYSFSRSERWNYDENRWAIYSHDQTHILQLIGSLKFPSSQEVGVRLRYVTGDPITPILGTDYFDATLRENVPKYGPVYSQRVNPYISFDLRYEKRFIYNLWQWSLYVDVTHIENLFGKGYKSPETGSYRWNYDYTQKIILSDVTRPAVGLRVEF
jgi:TonB family protein